MGMPDLARWTRERVLALPSDGNRYELIDGELLVSPTPRPLHQVAVVLLDRRLDSYVQRHGLGLTMPLAADLEPEPGQVLQPDLFVLPPGPRFLRWEEAPPPILVVEVLSPSTARYDRGLKRRFYQRAGVPQYWVVDVDGRVIERWQRDEDRPDILDGVLAWQPDPAFPGLEIDLVSYFREVAGEP
jgi:Uma2 family endonuclease